MSHFHVNDPSRTGNFTASLPFAVINVAAGKAPMQSSTHQDGIPQKAVDGSTSGLFSPQTCSLTQPEVAPLWYVNLLEPFMIQLVRIDFGRACCGEWGCRESLRQGSVAALCGMDDHRWRLWDTTSLEMSS